MIHRLIHIQVALSLSGHHLKSMCCCVISSHVMASNDSSEWGDWDWTSPEPVLPNEWVLKRTELVESVEDAERAVRWIWDCKLDGTVVIGLDLEGVHLGKSGYATLVQVSTVLKDVFIFDILIEPKIVDVIAPLLQHERVVKGNASSVSTSSLM